MLLGWHYSDYYSNAYALNQYLASRGYVVLSVNFRLGIGYGHDFHRPPNAGVQGASEYQDVKAGGEYLQRLPQVDAKRIGIYGGSYGGYLTALALARDSKLFAAGVDIHGVHNWTAERAAVAGESLRKSAGRSACARYGVAVVACCVDVDVEVAGAVDSRRRRSQRSLQSDDGSCETIGKGGVTYEELVIPDDTHHFMRHANLVKVNNATVAFFDRIFGISRGSE